MFSFFVLPPLWKRSAGNRGQKGKKGRRGSRYGNTGQPAFQSTRERKSTKYIPAASGGMIRIDQ